MAGVDKTSPGSQHDKNRDHQGRDSERKSTGDNATNASSQQSKSGVIKKMDKRNRQDTAMVDHSFDRQLNQLYSDVVSEPLPKEFLELIEKLREKTPK
jgi:hypothetical protein